MKASDLINELKKAMNKVGDVDVCMVHPTGVEKNICILTNNDYHDDGIGMLGGNCAKGMISIDYD